MSHMFDSLKFSMITPDETRVLSSDTIRVYRAIEYFIQHYEGVLRDGKKWIKATLKKLGHQLNVSTRHLSTILNHLAALNILKIAKLSKHKSDRTNYYSFDKEAIDKLISKGEYKPVTGVMSVCDPQKRSLGSVCTMVKAETFGDLTATSWTASTNGKERSDMATGIPDDQAHHAENACPVQALSEPATYNDGNNALKAQQESLAVEEIPMQVEKKDKESDINGGVDRVAQAIVITDRCVADDGAFTGIKKVLVEHQNVVTAVPVEVPLSWQMESAIRIWNDHIGSIKPSSRVSTTINDYMAAAMKGYFRSHSLDDFTAYCLRISRSPNLMGDKFNLIMGVCLSESFLKKVDQKIISMALPLPSDRPPEASKMALDGFTPQEMILRVYVASSLGIAIYNGWFKDLDFSEGKLKGYRDGFHRSRLESSYIATLIRVEELHKIIIKHT